MSHVYTLAPNGRCHEYSRARGGICDRPLDQHGNCDRASDHADHLAHVGT